MSEAYEFTDEIPEEGVGDAMPAQASLPWVLQAINSPNLAFDLPDELLNRIGAKVCEEFKIDDDSRMAVGWNERYEAAMKLALQVKEDKSYPWPKASNVKFPLLSTAAIQFNARAYPAMIDGPDVVKGSVKGKPTEEKLARADRVAKHMSWQLLEEMDDWEEDTDRLLIQLPIVGCAFRKTWFDPLKGYNCSHLVSAGDFVVNYWTKDLETAPRATHVLTFYPYEIEEKRRAGVWLDVDLGRVGDASNDDDAPHRFLEQYRLWDLDDDGYPEPYTVTVHEQTQKVVRIVARFDERGLSVDESGEVVRIEATRCFTKYGFIPSPDGGFYDVGFGTLLGPLSETINSTINQLMDAGHLANVQGGFIGAGVSIKSGNLRFQPGEWKKVEVAGGALAQSIVPLPVKEPSTVLFQLLGTLIEAAKDVTATQDILGGSSNLGTMPVGTVSALIEQGLKTFTAIVKRLHRALKKELAILYRLNGRYLSPEVYFTFQDVEGVIAQADYAEDDLDIVPVSDPNMATDMQRMAQAQFLMQFMGAPGVNPQAIVKRAWQAARIPDADELMQQQQGPPPPDPKLVEAQAKAAAKDRELDIKAAATAADIANKNALTQKTELEIMMAGPEMALLMDQVARTAVQHALAMVANGGQPPVQQGPVPGMEGPPGQPPVPPVPAGPAGGPGGAMGLGGGDAPGPAMQGPPDGGAGLPGMG